MKLFLRKLIFKYNFITAGTRIISIQATDTTGAVLQYFISKDDSSSFSLAQETGITYVTLANNASIEGGMIYSVQVAAQNPSNKLTGETKI